MLLRAREAIAKAGRHFGGVVGENENIDDCLSVGT
jgi:hypothetical protein